jgi:ferritin-like metal-binding protein YciE
MDTSLTITTLHQLLNYDVCKLADAEVKLSTSLPGWTHQVGSIQLKIILQQYLTFVERHVRKLDVFFEEEKTSSFCPPNRVMQALIAETNEMLVCCLQQEVRDVSLLACLQAINHFKISSYGTAAAFANALGMGKAAVIFHEAEVSEKYIDDQLSQLAEYEINRKAKTPFILAR